jgi:hypothetical protein
MFKSLVYKKGVDKVLVATKNSSTSEVSLLPERLFFLVPISMGEPLKPCRKKIAASASTNGRPQKMETMFLRQNPTSFKNIMLDPAGN